MENVDVPSFPVNTNNFIGTQIYFGGQYGQPVSLVAMSNKDNLHLLFLLGLYDHSGQNTGFAGTFLYLGIQSAQAYPLTLMFVKYLQHILGHADNRQMATKLGQDRWPTRPTVHEDVVCLNAQRQNPFYHTLKMFRGLGGSLQSPPVATGPFIQDLRDILRSLLRLCRRTQDEIQRQKTESVGPAQGEQLEPLQCGATGVVKIQARSSTTLERERL